MKFYFLLRCPKCGNDMKYHSDTRLLENKRKACVYCGKSFKIKDQILKEIGSR